MAITYIGSTVHVSSGSVTSGAATLANIKSDADTEIGGVISVAELGDTSEDVSFDLLKGGRKTHVNGVRDIGSVSFSCEYISNDGGQNRIRTLNNTNTPVAVEITDSDGQKQAFRGVVANYRVTERTASSYKGCMFDIRGQSDLFQGT